MNDVKEMKEQEQQSTESTAVTSARLMGIAFVLMGIALVGVNLLGSWELFGGKTWLIFLLIPVAGALGTSYRNYVNNGRRMNGRVLTGALWALFPFAMLAAWSLGMRWTDMWPLTLVLIGVTIVLNQSR